VEGWGEFELPLPRNAVCGAQRTSVEVAGGRQEVRHGLGQSTGERKKGVDASGGGGGPAVGKGIKITRKERGGRVSFHS